MKAKSQAAEFYWYRNVWPCELPDPIWRLLLRDLHRLHEMPKVPSDIARRRSGNILPNRCLHKDVKQSFGTALLLERLMDAFIASSHFGTLSQRLDFGPARRHYGLIQSRLDPLMNFWASREFPCLHRKLFGAEVKRNLGCFRSVSLDEFFQYAPLFVLYGLKHVLATAQTANWAFWIISGKNLRRAPDLPFPLTRRMAHFTINAPRHLTFSEALLFGRVRGLGGSLALFKELYVCLRQYHRLHEFHIEKLLFFVVKYQKDLYPGELSLLLGYLWHRFFDWRAGGQAELEDCSLARIRREMRIWYRETQAIPEHMYEHQNLTWVSTKRQGFSTKIDGVHYRIIELTSYRELREEGNILSHCVASYVEDCQRGFCSIWSLRARREKRQEKLVVTIELRANGYINQALGELNTKPKPDEMAVIRDWAGQEGLRFRGYR